MIKLNSIFAFKSFRMLFSIQFLAALNDNLLKSAILVLFTFSHVKFFNVPPAILINIAVLLLILPFLLFSSYAGKLADTYNQVTIIKLIKLCEITIVILASIGFYYSNVAILLLTIFLMGVHSAFFGPIKYSILSSYMDDKARITANGYIEFSTFIAILIGQIYGAWLVTNSGVMTLAIVIIIISLFGLGFSLNLPSINLAENKAKLAFSKNFIKDTYQIYKLVAKDPILYKNLHSISWFWALGVIITTHLSYFALHYLGVNGDVFGFLLGLFSIGIGCGSLLCVKLSRGRVRRGYVVLGAMGVTLSLIVLLLMNSHLVHSSLLLSNYQYFSSFKGIINSLDLFLIGCFAGFYSVTCYNDLQLSSPQGMQARVISANNILNSLYMVIASIISLILISIISVWWLLFIVAIVNLGFIWWYKHAKS